MSARGDRIRRAGLYIHVPFCASICPYCDFAVARGSDDDRARYVRAVSIEIGRHAGDECDWTFDTVYLGGGTPSALSVEQLGEILAAVRDTFTLDAPRVYLEANPEDVDEATLAAWRSLGIETLSLGVQSFDSRELQSLGRLHRREGAERSVALAMEAGFRTVSVDLIYGLQGQSLSSWHTSLETSLGLGVDHLSCYQLTFHEATPFGRALVRGRLAELEEHGQADFFIDTHRYLRDRGWAAYEVSNFARSDEHRSKHNQKYWDHTPYLGVGPSAHSYRDRRRWWNEREWRSYARRVESGESPIAGCEVLDDRQLALECVMLGLRTAAGVDLDAFERRFGIDLAAKNRALLAREPRLVADRGQLRCSPEGLAIADGLAARLVLS